MSDGRKYPKKDEKFEMDDFGDPVKNDKPNILTIIALFIFAIGVSWVLTCMALYVVAECFDINFNLGTATLIWLALIHVWFGLKK